MGRDNLAGYVVAVSPILTFVSLKPLVIGHKLANTQETDVQKHYQLQTGTTIDPQKELDTTSFAFAHWMCAPFYPPLVRTKSSVA